MRVLAPLVMLGCAAAPDGAAVFERRCLNCHGSNGSAPWAFDDIEVVRSSADVLTEAVMADRMPPWLPGPETPPIVGDYSLRPGEKAALVDWFQAGAALHRGDALQTPGVEPMRVDVSVPIPEHQVRGEGWRCFLVDLPEGAMVGFDVEGSAAVHHVLLGTWPESARADLEAMDARDADRGWSCPNLFMARSTLPPEQVPVLWFPSPEPTRTAPKTGVRVGGVAVVQVHGLGAGMASGELQLMTETDVLPEVSLALGTGEIDLPEEQLEVVVSRRAFVRDWAQGRLDGDVAILGSRGHGHGQLQSLRIEVDDEVVLDIPNYDPHFQARFVLEDPIRASPDAVLSLTCVYDNTPERRREASSYGEEGEMCGGWVFAVPWAEVVR